MIILLKRITPTCDADSMESIVVRANSPQEAMELAAQNLPVKEAKVWRSASQVQSFMIDPQGSTEVILARFQ